MGSSPAPRDAADAPPAFRDRAQAGARLGARLREILGETGNGSSERSVASACLPAMAAPPGGPRPVVLALPRGGVPVAAEVARALHAPLDILLVRKLGHPEAPELGLGAIAEDGAGGAAEPFFDEQMLAQVGLRRDDLAGVGARERAELARRTASYAPRRPGPGGAGLAAALVIVVDDGLATGVTARAALRAVRARGARRVILAVPVAAPDAARAVKAETVEVVALLTPRRFRSVGEWYADFGQLSDADVLALLARGGTASPATENPGTGEKPKDRG
jgi:putative phosphoribosyl transferase